MEISTKNKTAAILFCLVIDFILEIQGVSVRPFCFKTDTGYRATFRLKTEGAEDNRINGLQAHDASNNPKLFYSPAISGVRYTAVSRSAADSVGMKRVTDTMCRTSSKENGFSNVYSLTFEFTTSESTCGSYGSKVQIRATGTNHYWGFDCGTGNAIPNDITPATGVTVSGGAVPYHHHLPNPWDVRFQAFEASGSNTPARSVSFGQDVKLRLIYCFEYENGPDNWGWLFHTGFVPHATASGLILQIVTPGLGTNVHIQGTLAGSTLDLWVEVKRDYAAEVRIPTAYMQTDATYLSWTIQPRGIRIESRDDRIGVRVISSDGSGSSFIVLPDDVCGKEYNGITLQPPANEDGEMLVVATENGTSVSIVYNDYGPRTDLDVDGVDADTGSSTDNIMMDEFDILHVKCDFDCYQITLVSDKPIAVIYGVDDKAHHYDTSNAGHVSTQLIPVVNYDHYFVLVRIAGTSYLYIAQNDNQDWDTAVYYQDFAGAGQTLGGFPYFSSWNGEFRIQPFPIGNYIHYQAGGPEFDPSLFPIPSVDQWGALNYFYVKEGANYSLVIVARVGELENIEFQTGSVTTNLIGTRLGDQPDFIEYTVRELDGLPDKFIQTTIDIMIIDTRGGVQEQGIIELKSHKSWHTFQVIVQEEKGSYRNAYLPWGIRYPKTNPCQPDTFVRPGDLKNNDCDDFTDEEIANGIDDDGDGEIDEDLALDIHHPVTGIYVKDLYLCPDAECSSRTHVHSSGCYNNGTFLPGFEIKPFVHNTNLADEFDNYYVIETPFWHTFRTDYDNGMLYFEVLYGMCFGDLSRCEQSCQNSDRKRSVDGEQNGVRLAIPVTKDSTHTTQQGTRQGTVEKNEPHPCDNNPVYWVTMLLLLVLLTIEVAATIFFFYKWYNFRQLVNTLKNRHYMERHMYR